MWRSVLFNTILSSGKTYKHFLIGDMGEMPVIVSERYSNAYSEQTVVSEWTSLVIRTMLKR